MEVKDVLRMNSGEEETSYAKNSLIQKEAMSKTKPMLRESIEELYLSSFPECLNVADLGCSSGPNSLLLVREIIDIIHGTCQRMNREAPMFNVFLNDLPGNDFNTLFKSLPNFYEKLKNDKGREHGHCFISGVPGTFYGRLFPNNFLHFVHSSYSLHWRSQVPEGLVSESGLPLNKGNIEIGETSPPSVCKAYLDLFERDFTSFLRARSEEMITGGHMFLIMLSYDMKACSSGKNNGSLGVLLGLTLNDMVLEGLIEEAKLDQCNLPYYAPDIEEARKVIETEGSFSIREIKIIKTKSYADPEDGTKPWSDKHTKANYVAMSLRVVLESILASHFGKEIMNDLFERFAKKIEDNLQAVEKEEQQNVVISLRKK